MDAYLGVICFNTAEAGKASVKAPTSWKDMLNPELKGKLVMPHPASSGTGYLMVGAWLQTMGEAEGWKFMDGLHENIAVYTHSGSAPCVQAAKGERVAGIALDMRGASEKTKGAPLEVIIPDRRHRLGDGGHRHRQGHQEPRAAKKVADWVATKRRQRDSTPRPTRSWRMPESGTTRRTIRPTPKADDQERLRLDGRRTASASWPSGRSATTRKRRRRMTARRPCSLPVAPLRASVRGRRAIGASSSTSMDQIVGRDAPGTRRQRRMPAAPFHVRVEG